MGGEWTYEGGRKRKQVVTDGFCLRYWAGISCVCIKWNASAFKPGGTARSHFVPSIQDTRVLFLEGKYELIQTMASLLIFSLVDNLSQYVHINGGNKHGI